MMSIAHVTEATAPSRRLLLAFELGQRVWKLGFTTGLGQRPRVRQIPAGAVGCLASEIARAKQRLQLPSDAPVISCFEAGRDGFWLDRYLQAQAITSYVVDSASIEVNRRARRAKTDRLDLQGLLRLLARFVLGDQHVWRVIRVPAVPEEDARHLQRTRETIQQDRTRVMNRLKGLLTTQGVQIRVDSNFPARVETVRLWDGTPLPDGIRQRLLVTWRQLEFLNRQLHELDEAQAKLERERPVPSGAVAEQLQTLRAIGSIGAWVLTTEIFAWRRIRNGRQLGAVAGLAPTPFQSGETAHDQGITRAGNRHVRRTMIQLAWAWVRYQPGSALTHWYRERFGIGRRMRRIGIVALARKLLIALWRYLETGTLPEGAIMKSAA